VRVEHFVDVNGVKGISYFTDEKMYLKDKGLFEQGAYKNTGLPKKAHVFIQEIKPAYQNPKGVQDQYFYVSAGVYFWNSEQEKNDIKRISDFIDFSRLMPDWYYQFLFIDEVPAVLTSKSINLFVKPTKESTHHASTSSK
jgi:hypothetical protein